MARSALKRRWVWMVFWAHLQLAVGEDLAAIGSNFTHLSVTDAGSAKDLRGIFSPRMDYNQWKPLGRGDPLKNDPTYDYVPPVLDRVHYWIDPVARKPAPALPGDSQKTEILLLGVSSKKPSVATADSRKDNYDSFLKFVDGPKFSRPHYYYPSLAKTAYKISEQRMPYTMLMPPPPDDAFQTTATTASTTPPPLVTVQAANLVYQSSSWNTESSTKKFPPPEPYMEENISTSSLITADSEHINYVTPPPLPEEIMHRGQVSDDNLDISNTYVKIGKTEAQVHSTAMGSIPELEAPLVFSHSLMTPPPLTLQTLQSMQSMQPPPVTTTPVFKKPTNPILNVLEREKFTDATTVPSTTITSSLTTDPLFKHYKQPVEPLRGPLYLIIQGHSKVKTYGPSKEFHGIKVHETNEITDDREELQVKHLHSKYVGKEEEEEESSREGRSGSLQTLKHVVETGLGAIDFPAESQEAELNFSYKVGGDATSEKYHRGIVEAARKLGA